VPVAQEELRNRTKSFALRMLRVYRALPTTPDAQVIGRQLLRSATSVAANHRAACRARSRQEFAAKVGIVVEEADETLFWLEILVESGLVNPNRLDDIIREARELTAIFTASHRTSKGRKS